MAFLSELQYSRLEIIIIIFEIFEFFLFENVGKVGNIKFR